MLIDTHAHIHFADSYGDLLEVIKNARDNDVTKIITVGTDLESSPAAVDLAFNPEYSSAKTGVQIFATVGLHPNSASLGEVQKIARLARQYSASHSEQPTPTTSHPESYSGSADSGPDPGTTNAIPTIVAIGECGLDYYRDNAPCDEQIKVLEAQIALAEELDLPLIFHVREAFDDFFEVLMSHENIRGVIHSFTGGPEQVEVANQLGLYFGLNGIMTFTRDETQLEAAKLIPTDKMLLETDCPYLAPAPLRGKRNEPANVSLIAKFLADLRGETIADLAEYTSGNALKLFKI